VANAKRFGEQAEGVVKLLSTAPPSEEQQKELGFLLTLGELFTLVVYGQLIIEQAALTGLDDATLDAIFDVMVRDFSAYAVTLHGHPSTSAEQRAWALENVREPVPGAGVWERVEALAGAYEMTP
jgi:acyl-CoA dehydrogenase